MNIKSLLFVILTTGVGLLFSQESYGFIFSFDYDCGLGNTRGSSKYTLTIGMDENATDALDPKIDSPAPPIPPEVCYAHFICPEGKAPFNVLWKDIRGLSDKAEWVINNVRNSGGGVLTFEKENIPENYTIWVSGANLRHLKNNQINTDENDLFIDIIALYGINNNPCAIASEEIIHSVTLIDDNKKEHLIEIKEPSELIIFDPKLKSGRYIYKLKNKEREIGTGTIMIP